MRKLPIVVFVTITLALSACGGQKNTSLTSSSDTATQLAQAEPEVSSGLVTSGDETVKSYVSASLHNSGVDKFEKVDVTTENIDDLWAD